MKNKDTIPSCHDLFFKKVLSDKHTAIELIQTHVPNDICKHTDFQKLELQPTTFIDNKLRKRESDLLYKTNFTGKTGYFYVLLEHQSTPDITMPLRCARYITLIQERHLTEYKINKVPYVYPLVFYNGKTKYNYPTDIRNMLDAPKELTKDYRISRFQLIDLNIIEDTDIRTSTWSGLTIFAMKHAYDRELCATLGAIIRSLEHLDLKTNIAEFSARQTPLFEYIMSTYKSLNPEEFMQMLQHSHSEVIRKEGLSLAEKFERRGKKTGLREGIASAHRAIVRNMLESGLTTEQIHNLTKISLDQINQFAKETIIE